MAGGEERRKAGAVPFCLACFPPVSFCVAAGERRDMNFFMEIFGGCWPSVQLKVVLKSLAGTCRSECQNRMALMTLSLFDAK